MNENNTSLRILSAFVLVAALSHSSKCRAWFSESDDQAHLVAGIDELLRRFGGTARRWRVDRMATVIRSRHRRTQRPSWDRR